MKGEGKVVVSSDRAPLPFGRYAQPKRKHDEICEDIKCDGADEPAIRAVFSTDATDVEDEEI